MHRLHFVQFFFCSFSIARCMCFVRYFVVVVVVLSIKWIIKIYVTLLDAVCVNGANFNCDRG